MGRDLYDHSTSARAVMDRIASMEGLSHIPDLCWNGPDQLLTRTDNVQPAITAISLMAVAALRSAFADTPDLIAPVACAGHSLGEYSAHYAAGNLNEEQVMNLVKWRGYHMNLASQPPHPTGGMIAVMGLPLEQLEQIVAEVGTDKIAVANINSRNQIILSGLQSAIETAKELLTAAKAKRVIPLNVSGAWHSPLMVPAQASMVSVIDKIITDGTGAFTASDPVVVANATAQPVRSTNELRATLISQITSPIRWEQCVTELLKVAGVTGLPSEMDHSARAASMPFPLIVEVGAGKVISGLVKGIDRQIETTNVEDMAGIDKLKELLEARSS